jgi:phage tail-like protein
VPDPITKEDHKQKDPYLAFKFWVQIDGINVAGFTECSAITIETEVFEYQEGGLNTFSHKLPVRAKYGNITLKHGLDPGEDMQKWYMDCMDGAPGKRKNVAIIIYKQHADEVAKRYELVNAYPVKWTGADLRADTAAGAIETLELAHDGLQMSK